MEASDSLDDLIECLWQILGSGMKRQSTFPCREKCLECLERLAGADHHYTQCFKNFVQHGDDASLLICWRHSECAQRRDCQKELPGQEARWRKLSTCGPGKEPAIAVPQSLASNLMTPKENK
jgi:hypothetical protein